MYKSPLDFAANLTADFVMKSTKPQPTSVLDVGCGDGLIAAALAKRGLDLLAIDSNPQSVKKTRALGVTALCANLLDFEHSAFDLVLASRALHHMPDLVSSIDKLKTLLKPNGRLLIDDFGFELIEAREAAWLIEQTKKIKANSIVQPTRHAWLLNSDNLDPQEAFVFWREIHWLKHELVTSAAMKTELTGQLQIDLERSAPYLFRYLCDLLPQTEEGAEEAQRLLNLEQELITAKKLAAIGFRMSLHS